MLVNVVLPDFKSQCAFLRLRACSTFEAFISENIEFSEDVFGAAFVAIKTCLSDTELPVRGYSRDIESTLLPLIHRFHGVSLCSCSEYVDQALEGILGLRGISMSCIFEY